MAIKKKFKCSIPNTNFVLSNGKNIPFSGGVYITDDPVDIAELMREIVYEGAGRSKHPHIYVDVEDASVDTTLDDEIAAAQLKAKQEVLAKHGTDITKNAVAAQMQRMARIQQEAQVDNEAKVISQQFNQATPLNPNQAAALNALSSASGQNAAASNSK